MKFSLFLWFCSCILCSGEIYPTVNVKDFGAKGNGSYNDYEYFKKAVELINKNKGGTLIIPQGHYILNEYISDKQNKDLRFENLEFLDIQGNNSLIEVKGNFHRNMTRQGKKHTFSEIRSIVPFFIRNSKNISISDLEIDGNADHMTRDEGTVEAPGHLVILDECSDVVLSHLDLHHAMADGLVIKGKDKPSTQIKADNVISSNNARQGLTIGCLLYTSDAADE